jgi:hypothetical protein
MSLPMMHRLYRLAEQRALYYAELATSGRWEHYFSRDELDSKLKETAGLVAYWQKAIGIARSADVPTADVMPPVLVSSTSVEEAKAPEEQMPEQMPPEQMPSNVTPLFAKAG